MPIIGFGNQPAPWVIDNNLSTNQLATYTKILNAALHSFKYKNNKNFTRTIKINVMLEGSYIATYDVTKSGIDFGSYKNMLEDLINECNNYLISDFKTKKAFINYKFDLQGNWEMGRIVILTNKK
jgi:hypothetical protein